MDEIQKNQTFHMDEIKDDDRNRITTQQDKTIHQHVMKTHSMKSNMNYLNLNVLKDETLECHEQNAIHESCPETTEEVETSSSIGKEVGKKTTNTSVIIAAVPTSFLFQRGRRLKRKPTLKERNFQGDKINDPLVDNGTIQKSMDSFQEPNPNQEKTHFRREKKSHPKSLGRHERDIDVILYEMQILKVITLREQTLHRCLGITRVLDKQCRVALKDPFDEQQWHSKFSTLLKELVEIVYRIREETILVVDAIKSWRKCLHSKNRLEEDTRIYIYFYKNCNYLLKLQQDMNVMEFSPSLCAYVGKSSRGNPLLLSENQSIHEGTFLTEDSKLLLETQIQLHLGQLFAAEKANEDLSKILDQHKLQMYSDTLAYLSLEYETQRMYEENQKMDSCCFVKNSHSSITSKKDLQEMTCATLVLNKGHQVQEETLRQQQQGVCRVEVPFRGNGKSSIERRRRRPFEPLQINKKRVRNLIRNQALSGTGSCVALPLQFVPKKPAYPTNKLQGTVIYRRTQIDKNRSKAATKLQFQYRAYKFNQSFMSSIHSFIMKCKNNAANIIQRYLRRYIARKSIPQKQNFKIQQQQQQQNILNQERESAIQVITRNLARYQQKKKSFVPQNENNKNHLTLQEESREIFRQRGQLRRKLQSLAKMEKKIIDSSKKCSQWQLNVSSDWNLQMKSAIRIQKVVRGYWIRRCGLWQAEKVALAASKIQKSFRIFSKQQHCQLFITPSVEPKNPIVFSNLEILSLENPTVFSTSSSINPRKISPLSHESPIFPTLIPILSPQWINSKENEEKQPLPFKTRLPILDRHDSITTLPPRTKTKQKCTRPKRKSAIEWQQLKLHQAKVDDSFHSSIDKRHFK